MTKCDTTNGTNDVLAGDTEIQRNTVFNDISQRDELLSRATCRLFTLQKGDAILLDARALRCGKANESIKGSTGVSPAKYYRFGPNPPP